MANERLRSALARADRQPGDLAQSIGVDPKTVARWLSGRLPHPRHRQAVARALGQSEAYLWPSRVDHRLIANQGEGELVALYPHRSAVPGELWFDLLRQAECQVDVLAYAALFLPELDPGLVQSLQAKADTGATVRIALGDPRAPALRCRGEEEGIGEGMAARAAMTLRHFAPPAGTDSMDVRVHGTTLYNSIFRFDDDMLVNTHVFGAMAYRNPVLHLRNTGSGAIFAAYAMSFEKVWARAVPYQG